MTNKIEKECPTCGHPHSEIIGVIIPKENGNKVSYNLYKCLSGGRLKAHQFKVRRKGDKVEQALTEKYINSTSIKLK